MASICIRCGKTRIVVKSWNEKINGSTVTYTENACPDQECQKIVENDIRKKMEKVRGVQEKSLERRKLNKRNKKSK